MKLLILSLLSVNSFAADPDVTYKAFRQLEPNVTWKHKTPEVNEAPDGKYTLAVDTPFAAWFLPLSKWVERNKMAACSWASPLAYDPQYHYYDGEIPCGHPSSDPMKPIYEIDLPAGQFTLGDWDYSVDQGKAFVSISRQSLGDTVTDEDLNTKEKISRPSSLKFADDIRVQNHSKGLTICTRVPGVQVDLNFTARTIRGRSRENPQVSDQRVYAPPVQTSTYLVAKSCTTVSWGPGRPLTHEEIQKPEVSHLSVGATFPATDPVLEKVFILDQDILRKKLVADGLFSEEDLKRILADGTWAPLLMAEVFTSDWGELVADKAVEILQRIGNPLEKRALHAQMNDQCRFMEFNRDADPVWTELMRGFCQEHVRVIAFAPVKNEFNDEQLGMGCYNYSANIHDLLTDDAKPLKRWWTRRCTVGSRAEMILPRGVESYAREFETVLSRLGHGPSLNQDYQSKMRDAKMDNYQFWMMLATAYQNGHRDMRDLNWSSVNYRFIDLQL